MVGKFYLNKSVFLKKKKKSGVGYSSPHLLYDPKRFVLKSWKWAGEAGKLKKMKLSAELLYDTERKNCSL